MLKDKKIRIARPSSNLEKTKNFYCEGLMMEVLGGFENHAGFNGLMLGHANQPYHLEFTIEVENPITPTPTSEDLLIFYIPNKSEWEGLLQNLESKGHHPVKSHNPYWDLKGKTYTDPDGYRIVLQNSDWG